MTVKVGDVRFKIGHIERPTGILRMPFTLWRVKVESFAPAGKRVRLVYRSGSKEEKETILGLDEYGT